MSTRVEGIISAWISTKGFGFIVTGEGKSIQKFFFHVSRVTEGVDQICEGAKVSFVVHPIREGKNWSAAEIEVGAQ
jgi:cold shock CspA family protein